MAAFHMEEAIMNQMTQCDSTGEYQKKQVSHSIPRTVEVGSGDVHREGEMPSREISIQDGPKDRFQMFWKILPTKSVF